MTPVPPTTTPAPIPASPKPYPAIPPGPRYRPAPEADPIPQQIHRPTAAAAAARAAAEAARAAEESARAAAERAAAYAAATVQVATTMAAYDAAKLAYASATAEYDASLRQAGIIHLLAIEARGTADASGRALSALIRALAQQQSNNAATDVLFNSQDTNLLYKLGTLDKLSQLTGNMGAIRKRVEADAARATSLLEQDTAAQAALLTIPVAETLAAMNAAEKAFTSAQGFLANLGASFLAGFEKVTPLDLAPRPQAVGEEGWVTPAFGHINSGFGPRPNRPVAGVGAVHFGDDIGAACGAAIYAANSGVVVAVGPVGTYGNWILIDHGNGVETGYAHVAPGATLVSVGESVIAGQVIAGVGSTGASTGCHLHFEVRVDGTRIDPLSFLSDRGVAIGG
ncbi:MAG: M23 family metallopeptidase [Cryobacterium sp.]